MIYPHSVVYNGHPFGFEFVEMREEPSFLGKTVEWIREDDRHIIAKICVYALAFFATLLLAISIIGIPVIYLGALEFIKQQEEDRVQGIRDEILQFQGRIIEALGGEDSFEEIQSLDLNGRIGGTDYVDFLDEDILTFPIMKGSDRYVRDFAALKLKNKASNEVTILVIQQKYADAADWVVPQGNIFDSEDLTEDHLQIIHEIVSGTHATYEISR